MVRIGRSLWPDDQNLTPVMPAGKGTASGSRKIGKDPGKRGNSQQPCGDSSDPFRGFSGHRTEYKASKGLYTDDADRPGADEHDAVRMAPQDGEEGGRYAASLIMWCALRQARMCYPA